ncbi:MAG: RNA methyltransferase [Ignavibacteriaceae bacterium]|nr:RNA methyltransferase [Ignavibacteriaceae bacterium]
MISKSELKYYSSLLNKKYRHKENKFIIEGRLLLEEALKSNQEIEIVISTHSFAETDQDFLLQFKHVRHETVSQKEFTRVCDTSTPQGIAGVIKFRGADKNKLNLINDDLIVFIDNISDPGNLGTIIRTCDWFGIKKILLSKNSVELLNPKTIRSSMGSVFHLNIFNEIDLQTDIRAIQKNGYKIYLADVKGEDVFKIKDQNKIILCFSNESRGPSDELREIADKTITIPRFGAAESLNVSSAAAILISHLARSHHY